MELHKKLLYKVALYGRWPSKTANVNDGFYCSLKLGASSGGIGLCVDMTVFHMLNLAGRVRMTQ